MKKKIILNIAVNFCLSAALCFNLLNIGAAGYGEIKEEIHQSGDWMYLDRRDHISVCGYSGSEEHITVPSEIDGREVTEVACINDSAEFGGEFFGSRYEDASDFVIKHITLPETVKRIGDYTFQNCSSLTRVDLPEGLIAIGTGAFSYCFKLKEAEIPDSVKSIGSEAFEQTNITSVNLPEGLEYIGSRAFSVTNITEAEIPDTVKYLGEGAFSLCEYLETVKLPKGISYIPSELFYFCTSLKSVEIPEGVTVIEPNAFNSCSSLEEIYIPSTVVSINDILRMNTSLKDIYFAADKETVEAAAAGSLNTALGTGNMTSNDLMDIMTVYVYNYYDKETAYSNVTIHYGEKREAEEKTAEEPFKPVFTVLAAAFSVTFIIFLCLYILQKIKNKPAASVSTPLPQSLPSTAQGNVLTSFGLPKAILCGKCGAESGKNANYCYNCGKKLTGKPSKAGGRERKK